MFLYPSHIKLDCILVEDEPLAIEMMLEYISKRIDLNLIGVADNLGEFEYILTTNYDLDMIFLDLKIRGGDVSHLFSKTNNCNTAFIIVSAYSPKCYKDLPKTLNIYFISKPVSLDRFNNCIDNVIRSKGITK